MTTITNNTPSNVEPHESYAHGHHWRNATDEASAAKLGMWLFLATELLMFSGFFCAYAAFRMMYEGNWIAASEHYLNWKIGGINTLMLLLSSFTVVMAIRCAQRNKQGLLMLNLWITQACAAVFLILKLWLEYWPKIQKGELPGVNFAYAPHGDYVAGAHDHIFLSVYWIATATHGFHVLVGMFVFAWIMWRAHKRHFGPKHYTALENVGLYWHVVDVIWIFLFPLLYLA
jgi:cytochrome c oxidase subunit 3